MCETAKTMLTYVNLPQYFWTKSLSTSCFTQSHSFIHQRFNIIPSDIINKRKSNVNFFHVFRCRCFIMNLKDNLSFKQRLMKETFLRYSQNFMAYRVMRKGTRRIEETFNLTFDDYYVKRVKHEFPHKPILSNSNEDSEQKLTFDINFDLIFGIPDR